MIRVKIAKFKSKRKKKKGWVVILQTLSNTKPRVVLNTGIYGRFKTKPKAIARRKALMREIRRRGG